MGGRTSKLTKELTDIICENIELGLSYNLTCQAAGISFQSFNEWMKAGEAGKDTKYSEFYNRVRIAEANCAAENLKRIREAAKQTWQASAWLLERRYPGDYGRKDSMNVRARTQNENLTINVNPGSTEAESLRSEILRRLSGDSETDQ